MGLYQLTDTHIPPYAAIAATVDAARAMGKTWAPGLVNALLRRFQRKRARLLNPPDPAPEVRWLFPRWLLEQLRTAWPQHWREIITANNARPPMTLCVTRLRITHVHYARQLSNAGLTARPSPDTTHKLTLDRPVPTAELPGFTDGLVSVQDAGAQLAAKLLDTQPGERVLDACAASGGKSAHILEHAGVNLDLTALDMIRLASSKCGPTCNGSPSRPESSRAMPRPLEAPGLKQSYHRILLDAPYSATGVSRRHPDIKWLRRERDIPALSDLQTRMLDALWPLLVPGGILLYATYSLLPTENEAQSRVFLGRRNDARARPLEEAWGIARPYGRQTLPRGGGPDGFYYAVLEKSG